MIKKRPARSTACLREAGETRSEDELLDNATWSSYDQFRRLLEVTARSFGGNAALQRAAGAGLTDGSQAEMTAMLQSLGSPSALLAMITEAGGAGLAPVIALEGNEVGPTEWVVREWFAEGFEPFREYCAWAAGLYSNIPKLFGLRAEVEKVACACDGAPACEYRIRWFPDDATAAADNFEARIQVLTARLEGLQQTVGDLVSDDDLERVLAAHRRVGRPHDVDTGVRARAGRDAVGRQARVRRRHQRRRGRAARGRAPRRDRTTPTRATSWSRCSRTVGATAGSPPSTPARRFFPQERVVLQAYARLVAAALDSAAAVEEARLQAAVRTRAARAVELAGRDRDERGDGRAHRRAVTAVIGCDRSAVILFEPNATIGRVVATQGYSLHAEARLRDMDVPVAQIRAGDVAVHVWDRDTAADRGTLSRLMDELGSVAVATIPIVINGDPVGLVVADVVDHPERLRDDPDVTERLRGLASQATIAIRNARLLESIRHQALHDSLTGLPNRTLILDRVEQMLARARRRDIESAALFIDLDGFKQVNDTLGHDAGDRLLRSVAARLSATLREADTIARIGGDEFVVLVEGGSPTGSPEFVAERLLEVLREPFEIDDAPRGTLRITASIGIAYGATSPAGDLLRDADIALYEAKTAGRDRFVTFEREMQAAVEDRLTLELDLRAATERNEFFLVYQPIFDLENGRVLGVEALLALAAPDTWRRATRHVHPAARRDEADRRSRPLGARTRPAAKPRSGGCPSATCTCRSTSRPANSTTTSSSTISAPHSRPSDLDASGPRDRDHRDRDHARRGDDGPPARASSRRSASASRSTTSAPATRRWPTSGSSRSTSSRSTVRSSRRSPTPSSRGRCCTRSCNSASSSV